MPYLHHLYQLLEDLDDEIFLWRLQHKLLKKVEELVDQSHSSLKISKDDESLHLAAGRRYNSIVSIQEVVR